MVQLNLNFTHACRHTRVIAACVKCAKLQTLVCAHTVAHNFGDQPIHLYKHDNFDNGE